jgi:hypothetical protein
VQYHGGHNEVVDLALMEEKWHREIKFYHIMHKHYPEHLLKILDIDHINKKIYYEIEDVDFWELAGCDKNNFNTVLRDWKDQMRNIFKSYREIGLYKFSIHPSSYFIVNGKLRSTNYFFTYDQNEKPITLNSVMSHVSKDRQKVLLPQMLDMGIDLYAPTPLEKIQKLAFKSFSNDYPEGFVDSL